MRVVFLLLSAIAPGLAQHMNEPDSPCAKVVITSDSRLSCQGEYFSRCGAEFCVPEVAGEARCQRCGAARQDPEIVDSVSRRELLGGTDVVCRWHSFFAGISCMPGSDDQIANQRNLCDLRCQAEVVPGASLLPSDCDSLSNQTQTPVAVRWPDLVGANWHRRSQNTGLHALLQVLARQRAGAARFTLVVDQSEKATGCRSSFAAS
jgi:hypothetical protein